MSKWKDKSLEDQLFLLGIIFSIAAMIGIFLYFNIIVPQLKVAACVWDKIFGLYCPGCGGTRALNALLHGHFIQSLWYHPLVLYSAVIFGSFMISQAFAKMTKYRFTKGIQFHNWFLYGALIVLGLNVVIKNVLRLCFHISL